MAQNIRRYYSQNITPDFNLKSFFNSVNPLSSFLPTGADYVPSWLVKSFVGNDKSDKATKKASQCAHIITKIALGGAAFGLGALALRALMYGTDKDTFAVNKTPVGKVQELYKRPTEALIQQQATEEDDQQKDMSLDMLIPNNQEPKIQKTAAAYEFAIGSLPLLASIFAAGIGAKKADAFFDKKKTKQLEKEQAQLLKRKQQLAIERVKKARGIKQPQKQEDTLEKEACLKKKAMGGALIAGAGALSLLVFLLGRQGGKLFHDANNQDTLKFKAYKKGLQEYNKARAFERNVDTEPIDPKMVQLLNSNLEQSKKTAPSIDQKPLQQIMI